MRIIFLVQLQKSEMKNQTLSKKSIHVHFIGALDNAVIALYIKRSKYAIISFPI